MKKRFHVAISVPDEIFEQTIDFYSKLFDDCDPIISDGTDDRVQLGNGKNVKGAWFNSECVNFYIFVGPAFSNSHGVDHIGIEFDTWEEARDCLNKCGRNGRFEPDPSGNTIVEIWSNKEQNE